MKRTVFISKPSISNMQALTGGNLWVPRQKSYYKRCRKTYSGFAEPIVMNSL